MIKIITTIILSPFLFFKVQNGSFSGINEPLEERQGNQQLMKVSVDLSVSVVLLCY